MLTQTLAIARNAFVESVRQPIYFVLVALSGVLQIFNTLLSAYSMGYTDSSEVSGDEKLFLDIGLATVLVCGTLLAAFTATSVISREIEQKTALTVVSKPVGRPLFVLGKYLGVGAAILAAVFLMLVIFHFALQHGVLSAALDRSDRPVLVLGFGTAALALLIALWGNYFYGWVFTSAAVYAMLPLMTLGLIATFFMDGRWRLHDVSNDIKPTIMLASLAVLLAMCTLTAVAVACSTRLGQVMTIVVCFGVFMFGLLSNHLVGRRAFVNNPIETIALAEPNPALDRNADLREPLDEWTITLAGEPRVNLRPGDSFFFAADPSGVSMAVPTHRRFEGDVTSREALYTPTSGPALVIASVTEGRTLRVVNAGGLRVARTPREGDYVFAGPTRGNPVARAVWGMAPNVQFFWLVDAVTQGHPVPPRYLGLLAAYTAAQVTAMLGIAVFLFQKREVG